MRKFVYVFFKARLWHYMVRFHFHKVLRVADCDFLLGQLACIFSHNTIYKVIVTFICFFANPLFISISILVLLSTQTIIEYQRLFLLWQIFSRSTDTSSIVQHLFIIDHFANFSILTHESLQFLCSGFLLQLVLLCCQDLILQRCVHWDFSTRCSCLKSWHILASRLML